MHGNLRLAILVGCSNLTLGALSRNSCRETFKKIEGAQKIGQLQLTLLNTHLKLELQLGRYREALSRAHSGSDEEATWKRVIAKASALVAELESQSNSLFGATVIDEVGMEQALATAKLAERTAEHIESLLVQIPAA
ncbi:MAG: hypothetical protein K2R93_19905 [Gemmatimonadaceae bacterium]|nr:hypothetical protein [Burkholderiaceae bacterium]MBY0492116.1 hypothetical protein [Gemmatimonadaceae bacterium]